MIGTLAAVAVVGIIVIGAVATILLERKIWNRGICKDCGSPWVRFDTDSGGGRLYKCNCPNSFMAVSWWFDRDYEEKKA
jgi:hypothetical protein